MSDVIWAAGFFDGEGCTFAKKERKERRRLVIDVTQKDRRSLFRFREAVGAGNIYGPYGDRECSFYHATGRKAEDVLNLLWPWLGEAKREQAERAIVAVRESR